MSPHVQSRSAISTKNGLAPAPVSRGVSQTNAVGELDGENGAK